MADNLQTELVLGALELAIWQRHPTAGVAHHSDHGCQYTALRVGARYQKAGIRRSMGSVGDGYDHALVESCCATLECELLAQQPYCTRRDARTAVFEYLAVFYNRQRRHSALGYLSPVDYERRYATTTPGVA
jgi:putative transposase